NVLSRLLGSGWVPSKDVYWSPPRFGAFMRASFPAGDTSSRCLRRPCPARASPAQSFSISELQAERTFPLLPQETQINAMTIIGASNPRLVRVVKSWLDISASPKVILRWSDSLVGSLG